MDSFHYLVGSFHCLVGGNHYWEEEGKCLGVLQMVYPKDQNEADNHLETAEAQETHHIVIAEA